MTTPTASVLALLTPPVTDRNIRTIAQLKFEWYTGKTGTTLAVADHMVTGLTLVFKNGSLLTPTTAFTIAGNVLTFGTALVGTDEIAVIYFFRAGS